MLTVVIYGDRNQLIFAVLGEHTGDIERRKVEQN